MALTVSTNVMSAIRDLLHAPPIFKALLVPSWKPSLSGIEPSVARKRSSEGTAETAAAPKTARPPERQQRLYQPPGGRFSAHAAAAPAAPAAGGQSAAAAGSSRGAGRSLRW